MKKELILVDIKHYLLKWLIDSLMSNEIRHHWSHTQKSKISGVLEISDFYETSGKVNHFVIQSDFSDPAFSTIPPVKHWWKRQILTKFINCNPLGWCYGRGEVS